jgi:magnesium-transporting ATPase (P-type)
MEDLTNYCVITIFICQIITTIVCASVLTIFTSIAQNQLWYIYRSVNKPLVQYFFEGLITYFILFNNFIPISLYVTMEITKVFQARLINMDPDMFYVVHGEKKPANAKTSSLVEELGQVDYVFSDKTGKFFSFTKGTLTQNKMEFLKFTVDGVLYGKGVTEIAKAAAERRGEILKDDRPADFKPKEDGFQFIDPRIDDLNYLQQSNSKNLKEFFLLLATCHDAIPEQDPNDPKKTIINASSPDEGFYIIYKKRRVN